MVCVKYTGKDIHHTLLLARGLAEDLAEERAALRAAAVETNVRRRKHLRENARTAKDRAKRTWIRLLAAAKA